MNIQRTKRKRKKNLEFFLKNQSEKKLSEVSKDKDNNLGRTQRQKDEK